MWDQNNLIYAKLRLKLKKYRTGTLGRYLKVQSVFCKTPTNRKNFNEN